VQQSDAVSAENWAILRHLLCSDEGRMMRREFVTPLGQRGCRLAARDAGAEAGGLMSYSIGYTGTYRLIGLV
jgi:hypothetical protein